MREYELLEKEWAEFNGLDPAGMVACSSGTAALHLALELVDASRSAGVLVPDFSMIAVPRAVVLAGRKPIPVDCDELLNIDAGVVGDIDPGFLAGSVAALIAVHTYGRRCDMNRLARTADDYMLHVIEDVAEAHGVRPDRRSFAATWSFYENKIVAGEEGGAVYFRNPKDAEKARSLRCLGFTEAHDFYHVPRGHNYRLADSLAAIVRRRLKYWYPTAAPVINNSFPDGRLSIPEQRREIERWYDEECPPEWRLPARDAVWVYDVRIPGLTPSVLTNIVSALNCGLGVKARHGFKPVSRQPEFGRCDRFGEDNALRASREVFYLPVRLGETTRGLVKETFEVIKDVYNRSRV